MRIGMFTNQNALLSSGGQLRLLMPPCQCPARQSDVLDGCCGIYKRRVVIIFMSVGFQFARPAVSKIVISQKRSVQWNLVRGRLCHLVRR